MARDLHADHKSAKNALNSTEAWVSLFEIQISDNEVFRLTNNHTAITWNSEVYSPFPIVFESMEETSSGDLPYLNIAVGNVDGLLSTYLNQNNGLLDKNVKLKIVHTSNLTTQTAVIETSLVIRSTTVSDQSVVFKLSHHPFFEVEFPHQRYHRHRCRWAFKSGECGWVTANGGTGSSEVCDKTLDGSNGCTAHNNQARFGGFPGIPRRRV